MARLPNIVCLTLDSPPQTLDSFPTFDAQHGSVLSAIPLHPQYKRSSQTNACGLADQPALLLLKCSCLAWTKLAENRQFLPDVRKAKDAAEPTPAVQSER